MANKTASMSLADRAMGLLGGWTLRHMDVLFRIARNLFPILLVKYKGKAFALVTRFDDVQEVFQRPNVFDVIYAPKIKVLMDGDNIFLGMKDEDQATRDKSTMRLTAPRGEALTRVKPRVEQLSEEVMAGTKGCVDIAMELTQTVTTRFFGEYFGTVASDVMKFSDQARLLFKFMFVDMNDNPSLRAEVVPAAAEMRSFVEGKIAERKSQRGRHDDMLERCLKLQDDGFPGMTDRDIRNNLIGMIVGGLPQPPMVIPQLFDVLLDRPLDLAAASAAARANDDALISKYVFEASRFYPLTPGLFRHCTEDYKLAAGTWRTKVIPTGALVMVSTRSAMFDGRRVERATQFRIDRPDYNYMHFGYGMHECFGVYMNRAMMPAICKSLLKRRNLRRAPGADGKLQMDGSFAKSLLVQFDV
ncbi:MAG TPA: cytochrome P450 [Micropepsaceae bacterium]|nr:cytochrome P450 [Micropepsaceae bacterium]